MDVPVSLRDEPARSMAYVRRRGPYAGIPGAIASVMAYLERRGLAAAGPPVGVFFTDPKAVPEAEAQWEVRLPLSEPAPAADPGADGVGVRRFAARVVAVTVHVGPYHAVGPSYAGTQRWIDDHRYTVVGPPEEAYLSPPGVPDAELRTEIRFPVALEPVALGP